MDTDPYSSPLAYFMAELKRLRDRAGMTQGEVAERTNYGLSTVSAYEKGRLIPSAGFCSSGQGLTCAYGRAFTILTSRSGPSVVHIEDARNARYLREYEQVMRYTTIFDYLRASALDDQKSIQLIKGEKK